jgi:hypothetical protein
MTKYLFSAILNGDNGRLTQLATSCRNIAAKQPKRSLREFYLSMARTAEKQIIINNSHRIYRALKNLK